MAAGPIRDLPDVLGSKYSEPQASGIQVTIDSPTQELPVFEISFK